MSLQKFSYDRAGSKVLYHTDYNPYFKQNTTLWDATDFIAALTQFVPPWGVRSIHYYGLHSSRCTVLAAPRGTATRVRSRSLHL